MKKYLLILLITTIFSQEGEIINAEAHQRMDGSGIVEVTYELLPDETFASFEVTADIAYTPSFVYFEWEGDNDNPSEIRIYINTGSFSLLSLTWNAQSYNCGFPTDMNLQISEEVLNLGFKDPSSENPWAVNPLASQLVDDPDDNIVAMIPSGTTHLHLFTVAGGDLTYWHDWCAPLFTADVLPTALQPSGALSEWGYPANSEVWNTPPPIINQIQGGGYITFYPENYGMMPLHDYSSGLVYGWYGSGEWNSYETMMYSDGQMYAGIYNCPNCESPNGNDYSTVELNFEENPILLNSNVSGEGIGVNILPGEHSFELVVPDGVNGATEQIRISAYSHIVDSELPFEMVTIPAGQYYDIPECMFCDGDIQTMDYSYEIMKYELTNAQFVEWVLENVQLQDFVGGSDLQSGTLIDMMYADISWDGNTLEISPGLANFPLTATNSFFDLFYEGGDQGIFNSFLEYYGLRIPTYHEWLYAARGTGQPYFPWSSEENCTPDGSDNGCDWSCVDQAFCINGGWPYSMDGLTDDAMVAEYRYEGGTYNNSSSFGVYDMIGNTPEFVIEEFNDLTPVYNIVGSTAGTTWYIDHYTNADECISSESPFSFCNNNHFMYELPYGNPSGASFINAGIRLVRTVSGD